MRIPYVRWALVFFVMVMGGHFLLRDLSWDQIKNLDFKNIPPTLSVLSAGEASTGSSLGDEFVVPLQWKGTWVAEVELNDLYEAHLVVDTGATLTSLSEELAFDLGLTPDSRYQKIPVETANGTAYVWVGQVKTFRIGGTQRQNLPVIVQDFSNLSKNGVDGLLGLNFLNEFRWTLDQQNGKLILQPKQ
jgi:clan AA aspartic protease (TIGR02281 family)